MLNISRRCCFLLLASLPLFSLAQGEEAVSRPRIGLVLGGGGARGAAHIGVLEVLDELKVPVDCVVGTSMGALVAGAYAAGLSPAKMREELAGADWAEMFVDNPEFSEINFRAKKVMRRFTNGSETGVSAEGVKYPPGAVDGEKIKLFFNQLVGVGRSERVIERLPLPLSIIATDIGTGERVVLRDGSLATAMRASMSVPGLLAPVVLQGRKLVDGGLVDNVPIGEARQRCAADVVIAVNVGSPLLKAEDIGSLLSVSAQMVNILTEQNVTRSLATLKTGDIYIKPDLGAITAGDFGRSGEAADRGRAAAEALREQLRRLAVDAPSYAAWRQTIVRRDKQPLQIDEVEVVGLKRVHPAMVKRLLTVASGDSVDLSEIDNDVLRIYGDGYYQSVDYKLLSLRDRNILRILPVEKSWGPDYLRLALNLEADSSDGSSFGLRTAYQKTLINTLGAEAMLSLEMGSRTRAAATFYQPLDPAQHFFAEAGTRHNRESFNIYQNDKRIAQYLSTESAVTLDLGANLGLLGQARLGWVEQRRTFERDIGSLLLPDFSTSYAGWRASLELDQFNRLYFPSKGWAAKIDYFNAPSVDYSRAEVDLQGAFSLGKTVFNGRFSYIGSPTGQLPFFDAGKLGGFLNMTAFAKGQLIGDEMFYTGIRAERIVGDFGLGLRGDMRLGLAFEAAHIGQPYTETNRATIQNSTAIYFGSETPIGPAYLGLGYSTSGTANIFLSLGTP